MEIHNGACPFNCWDSCALQVKIKHGKIMEIMPDPRQEVTGHFICSKGKKQVELMNHPERLTTPRRKVNGSWKRIDWEEALDLFSARLRDAVEQHGSQAILHYFDSGHNGLLKGLDTRFYSCLGGATLHKGSLCWGAGLQAQKYDFGDVIAHSYRDLVNSRFIILWGRNPADTAVHQVPFIKEAARKGARVVVVDPRYTRTARSLAHRHLAIKPGTDGALALGMAHLIINEKLYHKDFVHTYARGFAEFAQIVQDYPPEKVSAATDIPKEEIVALARDYAVTRPAALLLGYGLQRYSHGGNTVRALDALAALTGNVGIPGGGANYANFQSVKHFDHRLLSGVDQQPRHRYFQKPGLASFLEKAEDPPVKMAVFARGNPVTQMGNSRALRAALQKVDFKVTLDLFLNDTAEASDLVLPCTGFLEEENLVFTSMGHTYLNYTRPLLDPPGECRSELEIYTELACRLGLKGFPGQTPGQWLEKLLTPLLSSTGLTWNELKKGPVKLPSTREIPWKEWHFNTPDHKYHFYSPQALEDGIDPLPHYRLPQEASCAGGGNSDGKSKDYPLHFITPHPAYSIHSLHYVLEHQEGPPPVYLHPDTAAVCRLQEGDTVKVSSPRGSLQATARLAPEMRRDTVMIYEGHWHKRGGTVNELTPDSIADMGGQAALYDCLCRVDRV